MSANTPERKASPFSTPGRDLRYAYFHEVARAGNYGKIAIAHNLDDQVETFLLRIIKGTGIRGLGSIPVKREAIIRPSSSPRALRLQPT